MISKSKRDEIVAQALQELTFARRYKQGKVANFPKGPTQPGVPTQAASARNPRRGRFL
jgi:hypothetical protein